MKHLFFCLLGVLIPFLSFTQLENSSKVDEPKNADTTVLISSPYLVFFPTGVSQIAPNYEDDLNQIAEQLKVQEVRAELRGFTDDVGQPEFNRRLSQLRAESVRDYLLGKGVDASQLELSFFGESQPTADNRTASGRAQNRRVEIWAQGVGRFAAAHLNESGPGDTTLYRPDRVDELLTRLQWPEGTRQVARPLPTWSSDDPAISFSALVDTLVSANGATAMLTYRYQSGEAAPRSILLQINGASSFYDFPISQQEQQGVVSIPLGFSTDLGRGELQVVAILMNANGQLSQLDTSQISMQRLGTGRLQISLSWANASDQDLHLTLPGGQRIYYQHTRAEGGQLDRDDRDGYGPENIYWTGQAPDGTYTIEVDSYENGEAENPFVVTFNGLGGSRQFYGATRWLSTDWVATFVKKGDVITWLSQ